MKPSTCSPAKAKINDFSCYNDTSLLKLRELWNARHPDSKIKSKDSKEIWQALKKNMANVCNEESCWLRQNFAKHDLSKELQFYTFAPQAPTTWRKNKNEWLTSVDIINVMKQYEHSDPSFSFLGPSPIDFDAKQLYGECVWDELCHFNLMDYLKKNKHKIGMIFNLDEHWKDGSHWVSMFVDVKTQQICYFDSGGDDIPVEISRLKDRIIQQGKQCHIDFKFRKNHPFEHQRYDSECGIYCLYFIESMIKNANFSPFKNKRIPDKEMERHRSIYFRI
jgi:hypothetical protein